jgi:hypothetical protein
VGGLDAGDRRLDPFRTRLPSVALRTQGASQRAPSGCIWSQRHPPRSPSDALEIVNNSDHTCHGPFFVAGLNKADGTANDVEPAKASHSTAKPPHRACLQGTSPDIPTDRYSLSCTSSTINTWSSTVTQPVPSSTRADGFPEPRRPRIRISVHLNAVQLRRFSIVRTAEQSMRALRGGRPGDFCACALTLTW